jgi:hypothetical protein
LAGSALEDPSEACQGSQDEGEPTAEQAKAHIAIDRRSASRPATLVVEDGTGKANAESYVSVPTSIRMPMGVGSTTRRQAQTTIQIIDTILDALLAAALLYEIHGSKNPKPPKKR